MLKLYRLMLPYFAQQITLTHCPVNYSLISMFKLCRLMLPYFAQQITPYRPVSYGC